MASPEMSGARLTTVALELLEVSESYSTLLPMVVTSLVHSSVISMVVSRFSQRQGRLPKSGC